VTGEFNHAFVSLITRKVSVIRRLVSLIARLVSLITCQCV
jgi:hypothetical protein